MTPSDAWKQAATLRHVLALLQADGTYRHVLPLRIAAETETDRSWHCFERIEGDWAVTTVKLSEANAGLTGLSTPAVPFPFPLPDIEATLRAGQPKEGAALLAYVEALNIVARFGLAVSFGYTKPGAPTEIRKGLALGLHAKQLFVSDHDRGGETRGFLFSRMDGLRLLAGQRLPVWQEGVGYTVLPGGDEDTQTPPTTTP